MEATSKGIRVYQNSSSRNEKVFCKLPANAFKGPTKVIIILCKSVSHTSLCSFRHPMIEPFLVLPKTKVEGPLRDSEYLSQDFNILPFQTFEECDPVNAAIRGIKEKVAVFVLPSMFETHRPFTASDGPVSREPKDLTFLTVRGRVCYSSNDYLAMKQSKKPRLS